MSNDITRRDFTSRLALGALAAAAGNFAHAATSPPFTQVPPEFATPLAMLRSPLLFKDGRAVKTPVDWQKRRAEILADWHRIMGAWPPVVEHPKIEVVETTARGDITQRRVRVQIAPDQTGDGFVLLPKGKGPFPAVFVPYYDPET